MRRTASTPVATAARTVANVTFESLDSRRLMAATAGFADGTFGLHGYSSTSQNGGVMKQLVQKDGKVIALVRNGNDTLVERFDAGSGKLDTGFGKSGVLPAGNQVTDVALAADGKIVTVARTKIGSNYSSEVARFTTAGKPDTSFDSDGYKQIRLFAGRSTTPATEAEFPWAVHVDSSSRVTFGVGAFQSEAAPKGAILLARLTSGGKLDTSYNGNGMVTLAGALTGSTAIQPRSVQLAAAPDGTLVSAIGSNALQMNRIATNGSIKTASTIDLNNAFFTASNARVYVNALSVTPTNKVLYGGEFTAASTSGQQSVPMVGRLGNDLKADKTLNAIGVEDLAVRAHEVRSVAQQADGKIVVGSAYYGREGRLSFSVSRLQADGNLDETFGSNGTAPSQLYFNSSDVGAISILKDNRILVGASTSEGTVGFLRLTNDLLTGTAIGSTGKSGFDKSKAFDGDLTTYFDAGAANGNWVGQDLGTARRITQIRFSPRAGFSSRMNGGVFQASNSPTFSSGVVTLYQIAQNANRTAGQFTTQDVANTGSYRYVRYLSPNGSYGDVAEVQFIGTVGTRDDEGLYIIDTDVVDLPVQEFHSVASDLFASDEQAMQDLLK